MCCKTHVILLSTCPVQVMGRPNTLLFSFPIFHMITDMLSNSSHYLLCPWLWARVLGPEASASLLSIPSLHAAWRWDWDPGLPTLEAPQGTLRSPDSRWRGHEQEFPAPRLNAPSTVGSLIPGASAYILGGLVTSWRMPAAAKATPYYSQRPAYLVQVTQLAEGILICHTPHHPNCSN